MIILNLITHNYHNFKILIALFIHQVHLDFKETGPVTILLPTLLLLKKSIPTTWKNLRFNFQQVVNIIVKSMNMHRMSFHFWPVAHVCQLYLHWCDEQGWHSWSFLMEQEQLEDLSEQNNTIPDARPVRKTVRITMGPWLQ